MNQDTPVRSYAAANRELLESFERYLVARGQAAPTIRAYRDSVTRLVDLIGAANVADVERSTIRQLLYQLYGNGLSPNSINHHTCGLRSFFKFIRLAGVTKHDPMLLIARQKTPTHLPVVLTLEEVEQLIAAARTPFERAVPEILYSTGVRLSEFLKLRLEDIDFRNRVIRVHKGKGGKDRIVLFGRPAAKAIHKYQKWRPSQAGFLFEARVRKGTARPYSGEAIRQVLRRLARRAGLGRVHPHCLRRAMASHMLQRNGNIRAIQDLLGHERLSTTQIYTHLTAEDLKRVHSKFHPHGRRRRNAENK